MQKYTIENSKLLQISKIDVDISKTQLDYINSEKYPTLTMGISTERAKGLNDDNNNGSYVGDNSVSSSSLYKTYSYMFLNYSLFDFGRLNYKTKSQNFDIETKKNDYCIEQNNISQKLLDSYFNVRITEIKKLYLNQILNHSNNLYQYYKRLHEIGNIQKTDVVTNAIQIANLYNDISNNNKTYIENLEQLSNLSNYDLKTTNILESLSISKEIINKDFEDTNIANKYLDEKLGDIYEVKIKPNGEKLMVEGKERYLEARMSVTAEIKVGKRRVIEFFIYPIIKYLDEGLSVR